MILEEKASAVGTYLQVFSSLRLRSNLYSYSIRLADNLDVPYHRLNTTYQPILYRGITFYNSGSERRKLLMYSFERSIHAFICNNAFYSTNEFFECFENLV